MRTILAVFAAVAAACGGSTSSPTSSGGEPSGPPPSPSGSVTIQDFSFSPPTLTIKAGTAVKWTNNGPSAHTTTSDDGGWNSGQLGAPTGSDPYGPGGTAGGTYQFTFAAPGMYPYHCTNHPPEFYPNFVGTITVEP